MMLINYPHPNYICLNAIERLTKIVQSIINHIVYFYKNNKIHYITIVVEGYFSIRCFTYYGSERTPTLTVRHHDVIPPKSYRRNYFQ